MATWDARGLESIQTDRSVICFRICWGDGNGDKDGNMGLEADYGAVTEVEGGVNDFGEAASPDAAIRPGPGGDAVLVGPDKNKRKRRNAARAEANCSSLLITCERLSLDPATETNGDRKLAL